ncbi:NUDIX domain-containing protein [Agrilactobacillus yilanensis]|uniref:NUDIX domain-containing protein n=1 Tax=Agrilactobacillus yilanensis TaxID=2485997 RepID=A0ABW4J6D7_9LACO|nr:NUDIX domain-containing protein [Agrilactobacillus yilanensis]
MAKKELTLALIIQGNKVLLLNRYNKPYIGQWNGFGGKIEPGETPEQGIKRELMEETGITPAHYTLVANGDMAWHVSGVYQNRVHLFTARLAPDYPLQVPQSTREGLLQLFDLEWAMAAENYGMIADVKAVYPYMIKNEAHHFTTNFEGDQLIQFEIID